MFERLKLLIGEENFKNIKDRKVLLIGIGGVGGSCAISLIRAGIHDITIIDYDTVDITNLNRQIIAYQSTIGMKKVDVMKKMIEDINSKCLVTSYDMFLDSSNIDDILTNNFDYVIDACDFVKTKKELMMKCYEKRIKLISSMGTGNKLDPSKLEITDIRNTVNDPLARIFRKFVKDSGIKGKFMVLSSKEMPIKSGKIVASCSFVPNIAGELIASYVINDILKDSTK